MHENNQQTAFNYNSLPRKVKRECLQSIKKFAKTLVPYPEIDENGDFVMETMAVRGQTYINQLKEKNLPLVDGRGKAIDPNESYASKQLKMVDPLKFLTKAFEKGGKDAIQPAVEQFEKQREVSLKKLAEHTFEAVKNKLTPGNDDKNPSE